MCGVISKLEDKEFNRIRYLSAVLKNKLGDYKIKVVEEEKKNVIKEITVDSDYIMPVNKKKKVERRKGFGE